MPAEDFLKWLSHMVVWLLRVPTFPKDKSMVFYLMDFVSLEIIPT